MRRSLTFLFGITFCSIALLTGCASGRISERPTDATFCLLDCCNAFHNQYHRWPKDFAELSAFVQQSGRWKLGHYEQVQFASFPDGKLSVWDVSGGVTNSGVLTPAPDPTSSVTNRPPAASGDAVIRAPAGGSEIVIKTTSRMAGAIESLQWGGKEFIDDADHGRELQTCWNGNAGVEPIADETFNPTEAGSLDDGSGATSSSRLLEIQARGNQLEALSQPAFWLNPGETSGGKPARNKTILSDDHLRKRVVIGCPNLPHAIDCQFTVSLAAGDRNTRCVIEALTGYMPPEFNQFQVFDPKTGKLAPVDDGPGEQALPLVFSTADGKYAMGVFSREPEAPRDGRGPTYGRWRMNNFRVMKWNCVFRLQNPEGLSGDFNCHVFVAVGSLEDVRTTLAALQKM